METNYIVTHSGKTLSFDAPSPKAICIEDIAHALSRIHRFSGHLDSDWTVAKHSLLVAWIVSRAEAKCAALLHDAHEAYTGDISTPLKAMLGRKGECGGIYAVQHRIDMAIYSALGVYPGGASDGERRQIKWADGIALQAEVFFLSDFEEHFDTSDLESCGSEFIMRIGNKISGLLPLSQSDSRRMFLSEFSRSRGDAAGKRRKNAKRKCGITAG